MPRGQKTQTTRNQPRPLNPMWETGYGTELEARFAKLHNLIGLEGRLSNDPLVVALREVKSELKTNFGVSFEIAVGGETAAPAKTAPVKTAAAPAAAPRTSTKPAAAAPASTGRKLKARKIREDQIEALAVRGSVSDEAPYGRDAEGHPLAPYGVKKDGVPMLRRGRKAEAAAPAPAAKAAKTTATPKRGAEPTTRMPEPNTTDEFDLSLDDEGGEDEAEASAAEETETETAEASGSDEGGADESETASSDDIDDADIDDVLANL
jgi:hypothetical protein